MRRSLRSACLKPTQVKKSTRKSIPTMGMLSGFSRTSRNCSTRSLSTARPPECQPKDASACVSRGLRAKSGRFPRSSCHHAEDQRFSVAGARSSVHHPCGGDEDVMGSWLPENASSFGPEIDRLYYIIYYVTGATFFIVQFTLLAFLIIYRQRDGRRATYTH